MYINIGEDLSLRDSSIVGVFDLEKAGQSKRGREFLKRVQDEEITFEVGMEPKAFVITEEYGMERIYLTQLSAATIERRSRR